MLPGCHVGILYDGDNLSDHYAIVNRFMIPSICMNTSYDYRSKTNDFYKKQWEKADLTLYQSCLSNLLSQINLPVHSLICNDSLCCVHLDDLDQYYRDIICCLQSAADSCIPSVKVGFQKHWWSQELDDLKTQCIDITNLWKSVGLPRSGSINAERLKCKYRYKQAIRDAAIEGDKCWNENLFNHLCQKDNIGFWKSWRKRFCSHNIKPTSVLNGKCGDEVLSEFSNFYKNVYQPNTDHANDKFQNELDDLLVQHLDRSSRAVPQIDIINMSVLIARLKRNKAAGIDDIVSEHVIHGGQDLAVHLCLLFNALLRHSFVASDFCKGIIIPLLKNKHGDATKLEMYRGITISPVLSKLFEMVLQSVFQEFLVSDHLQFGFKKNSSCAHALFAFNESVRYCVSGNTKVYTAFLDSSKAFDKVLHSGLFVKMLRRNIPVCFVTLLKFWYSQLQCVVKWNGELGVSFPVICGVRQGGVLSPFLYALYVDELINKLRKSGYGLFVGNIFAGCVMYADDIVLISPSCHGLRKLVSICESYGIEWDIKFNPSKSQLATFGGKNPPAASVCLNGLPMTWVENVKYLGLYFQCSSGKNDWSHHIRRFYGQFNNIMMVLGRGAHEITGVHLLKTYCLPTLMYASENSNLDDHDKRKINVIWNNCFRHIFGCCWRDSVKPLQYFCHTLPLSYLLDQSKLLLWKKMHVSGNILLHTLSRLVKHRFIALGDVYGVKSWDQAAIDIKTAVWHTFARNVC